MQGGGREYFLFNLFCKSKTALRNKVYLEFFKCDLILGNIFSIEYSRWYKNMAKITCEVCG